MKAKSKDKSAVKLIIKKKKQAKPLKEPVTSGIKKQYLKTKEECRVTFRLPEDAAHEAGSASIVGDFNNWSISETPMKKLKNGDFTVTISLPCNKEYRFRYLIDGNRWENDWFADKYLPNCYGCDDSVVVV
ncbi:MAG: isoamylase early set domain-containing protein [Nitrospirae bacterium]|nr:isoamylase early set domain-containing protein [Nitrospirota bacterium]